VTNDIAAHLYAELVGVFGLERLTALGCRINEEGLDIGTEYGPLSFGASR